MTFSLAWFKTFSRQNSLSFLKYAHPSLSRLFMKLAPHTLQSISMFAPPHYPVHLRIPPFYKFRGKLSLHSYSHYRFHSFMKRRESEGWAYFRKEREFWREKVLNQASEKVIWKWGACAVVFVRWYRPLLHADILLNEFKSNLTHFWDKVTYI
jgi:hypothetical protein